MKGDGVLGQAWRLFWGRFDDLAFPPGSHWCLGLLIALAGWETGLNAPYNIADVMLVGNSVERLFRGDSPPSIVPGLLQGLMDGPEPAASAVAVTLLLFLIAICSLGGWILVASRVASESPLGDRTWLGGVLENWRMAAYFFVTACFFAVWLSVGGGLGTWLMKLAIARLPLRAISALPFAFLGMALLGLTFAGILYGAATAVMGGFLAVAEPKTPFFELYGRGRDLFLLGEGWNALGWIFVVACGWTLLKLWLSYLLLPFPIAGAGMLGLQTLGDGLLLLYTILTIAVIYVQGQALRAETPLP